MKKSIILLTLLSLIIIVGCVDYKTGSYTNKEGNSADQELLKEIAKIEQELGLGPKEVENAMAEENMPKEVTEEVILQELEPTTSEKETTEKVIRVKENEKVTLRPKVLDPDQQEITISYSKPLNENGEWATTYGDAGEYSVTVTATDGVTTSTKNVKIIVEKVNVAPTIDNLQDITVNEGEFVSFNPVVRDLNGDSVTVKTSKPLENGKFQTDFNSEGIYQITVTASDGELETKKTFTLTINNVNQKPILTNLKDISIKEGETLTLKPKASDPDGDKVTITISEPVGNDGVWKLGFTDNGEYMVKVTASDGKDSVSKTIKVTVEDVNAPVEFIDIEFEVN
jgi:hypothetical protein